MYRSEDEKKARRDQEEGIRERYAFMEHMREHDRDKTKRFVEDHLSKINAGAAKGRRLGDDTDVLAVLTELGRVRHERRERRRKARAHVVADWL